MRQKKAKRIRTLIRKQNKELLIAIRNIYGDKTITMSYNSICRAVKNEYNNNNTEVRKIVNKRRNI
jgi:hypothetical protein